MGCGIEKIAKSDSMPEKQSAPPNLSTLPRSCSMQWSAAGEKQKRENSTCTLHVGPLASLPSRPAPYMTFVHALPQRHRRSVTETAKRPSIRMPEGHVLHHLCLRPGRVIAGQRMQAWTRCRERNGRSRCHLSDSSLTSKQPSLNRASYHVHIVLQVPILLNNWKNPVVETIL